MRRPVSVLIAVLAAGNVAAWIAALLVFRAHPVLLGTALVAYSLGLRHAVDADHIAAIDNVTRKLMAQGQRPIAAGFYFSLGHASVVVAASLAVAFGASQVEARYAGLRALGDVVGTAVSVLFLFAVAAANLMVLGAVARALARVRRGGTLVEDELDRVLGRRGFLGRIFAPLFRLVGTSRHMYPLGLLFGLGFDTATEIALLGIAAAEASKGLPLASVLIFPALFTAGMALVDTIDSVLMVGAYGWAFIEPQRKLYYNFAVTLVSVLVAVVVGGVEALGLAIDKLGLAGPFWDRVAGLNDHLAAVGYVIVAVLALMWLVAAVLWRLRGLTPRRGTP
jgi:nickel/cobalt transporter (NiCoT) family protein